jgi:Domain of unknown function (DUF6371)
MNQHRYILEPYKGMNTRHHCPEQTCKGKNFVLYIDNETGQHIAPTVGRCNRKSSCGYHYTPKQYFQDNNISFDTPHPKTYTQPKAIKPPPKPVSFIDAAILKASLKGYEANHFVNFLISKFGEAVTCQLISMYFIGSSKHWPGATVFWQIDKQGKVRTGKIMLYSPTTGKRIKEPYNYITWVHTALKQPQFELGQCLFGLHLLSFKGNENKTIAIVESEKTAIIASVYLPQFIWLAVGSLTNLNADKCSILKGRNVILYPDLKGFDTWSKKAKELSHITSFNVSDLLERNATEADKQQGFDLADYLLKLPLPAPDPVQVEQAPAVDSLTIIDADIAALPMVFTYPGYKVQTILASTGQYVDTLFTTGGELLPATSVNTTQTDPLSPF